MSFPRVVQPETLDHLMPNDPRAVHSRRDLRLINRIMGARLLILNAIRHARLATPPRRILELGTGDGTLMLRLAQQLSGKWPNVQLGLLDRQNLVTPHTLAAIRQLGWRPEVIVTEVHEWASGDDQWDLVLANLFMHHFESEALTGLLRAIATRSHGFVACEPRRSWFALGGSHLVGLLGANDVTREDAVLSVKAGFRERELSSLWPHAGHSWELRECASGLFSHCFIATRSDRAK